MANLLKYLIPGDIRDSVKNPLSIENPIKSDFDPSTLGPKEVYLTWAGASRAQKAGISKKTMKSLAVIGAVIGLLLAIMGEFFLILMIGSLAFILYALSATPPEKVVFELSSHGIKVAETIYYWPELKSFFVTDGIFAVDTVAVFPGRIFVSPTNENFEKVQSILQERLTFFQQQPTTVFDRAYKTFVDKFNL